MPAEVWREALHHPSLAPPSDLRPVLRHWEIVLADRRFKPDFEAMEAATV